LATADAWVTVIVASWATFGELAFPVEVVEDRPLVRVDLEALVHLVRLPEDQVQHRVR